MHGLFCAWLEPISFLEINPKIYTNKCFRCTFFIALKEVLSLNWLMKVFTETYRVSAKRDVLERAKCFLQTLVYLIHQLLWYHWYLIKNNKLSLRILISQFCSIFIIYWKQFTFAWYNLCKIESSTIIVYYRNSHSETHKSTKTLELFGSPARYKKQFIKLMENSSD